MNATQDLSLLSLVTNASLVVQLIMLLLLLASLSSWYTIFRKLAVLRRALHQSSEFERAFWNTGDYGALYQQLAKNREHVGASRIFLAGYAEFSKLRGGGNGDAGAIVDSVRRAMKAASQREMDWLDRGLNGLATVGSVSPYVGLFGTVWGIMTAFRGLANVGQATLAHVAPGIAEALVATAMGLFAAIPAVVAYNRFTHDSDRLNSRFEAFMEEFSNILLRMVAR